MLLPCAVGDAVERKPGAADAPALSKARITAADRTRRVPAVAPEALAPIMGRLVLFGLREQRQLPLAGGATVGTNEALRLGTKATIPATAYAA